MLKEKPPVGFWPKRLRAGVAVAAAAGAADTAPSALPKLKPELAAGAAALGQGTKNSFVSAQVLSR